MMEQRACREVTMPALLIEILCCSIASWILVRSASFIWKGRSKENLYICAVQAGIEGLAMNKDHN